MNFGFSYIGLIFLLMLMIPNIIWSKNKPKDYEKYEKNENKILLVLERIGEVGNTCLALIFTDFNINNISNWSIILLVAFLLMILLQAKIWKDYYHIVEKELLFTATVKLIYHQVRHSCWHKVMLC